MSRRLHWALLVVALLSGCAVLQPPPTPASAGVPASPEEALQAAAQLSDAGDWSAAIAVLEAASERFPVSPLIDKELRSLRDGRGATARVLEDRIMVGDAENHRAKIRLLQELSRVQPDNLILMSRRLYWEEALAERLEPLTACAEMHVESEPALARRCFDLATELDPPETTRRRLARVGRLLQASEAVAVERRRKEETRLRRQRAAAQIDEAAQAIEQQQYRRALDILDQAGKLHPDHPKIPELRDRAWSQIGPQVEALVKLGDRLYLDEELNAAVGTWRAALTLKPGDEEIIARIERARTVLNRLETLREQQKPEGGAPEEPGR